MNPTMPKKKSNGNISAKSKKTATENKFDSTDQKNGELKDDDGILVETARKVETGVRLIGDKTVEVVEKVSDQTTEIAEITYDKIKKGMSDAFDRSSKTMSEMSDKAVKYINKYEDTIEMKKLSHDRKTKMQELGKHIFTLYKSKSQNINELLINDESQGILNELELLNKQIVKLGRRIKRKI